MGSYYPNRLVEVLYVRKDAIKMQTLKWPVQ